MEGQVTQFVHERFEYHRQVFLEQVSFQITKQLFGFEGNNKGLFQPFDLILQLGVDKTNQMLSEYQSATQSSIVDKQFDFDKIFF